MGVGVGVGVGVRVGVGVGVDVGVGVNNRVHQLLHLNIEGIFARVSEYI